MTCMLARAGIAAGCCCVRCLSQVAPRGAQVLPVGTFFRMSFAGLVPKGLQQLLPSIAHLCLARLSAVILLSGSSGELVWPDPN